MLQSIPYYLRKRIRTIVIDACLAGLEMSEDNYAEFLHKYFPNATIFASKKSFEGKLEIDHDKEEGITSVIYDGDSSNTLVLKPE
jgi:hypothetical protein